MSCIALEYPQRCSLLQACEGHSLHVHCASLNHMTMRVSPQHRTIEAVRLMYDVNEQSVPRIDTLKTMNMNQNNSILGCTSFFLLKN